jgi:hypothetical protein
MIHKLFVLVLLLTHPVFAAQGRLQIVPAVQDHRAQAVLQEQQRRQLQVGLRLLVENPRFFRPDNGDHTVRNFIVGQPARTQEEALLEMRLANPRQRRLRDNIVQQRRDFQDECCTKLLGSAACMCCCVCCCWSSLLNFLSALLPHS